MTALQIVALALVGAGATSVVFSRNLVRQAIVNGLYGLSLAVLFLVFQAPDVALSQIVVGTVASPLVLLAVIRRCQRRSGQ